MPRWPRCAADWVRLPMADWQAAETAPKDRLILADFGWPLPAVATWCEHTKSWAAAELEWNVCAGVDDPSFVTEYEPTLVGWMELPEVARG